MGVGARVCGICDICGVCSARGHRSAAVWAAAGHTRRGFVACGRTGPFGSHGDSDAACRPRLCTRIATAITRHDLLTRLALWPGAASQALIMGNAASTAAAEARKAALRLQLNRVDAEIAAAAQHLVRLRAERAALLSELAKLEPAPAHPPVLPGPPGEPGGPGGTASDYETSDSDDPVDPGDLPLPGYPPPPELPPVLVIEEEDEPVEPDPVTPKQREEEKQTGEALNMRGPESLDQLCDWVQARLDSGGEAVAKALFFDVREYVRQLLTSVARSRNATPSGLVTPRQCENLVCGGATQAGKTMFVVVGVLAAYAARIPCVVITTTASVGAVVTPPEPKRPALDSTVVARPRTGADKV